MTAARLSAVRFTTRDAAEVLRAEDADDTLFYVDPPYLESERSPDRHYAREMTPDDHARLLESCRACRGHVYVSGYRSDLYDRVLADWQRVDWAVTSGMSGSAGAGRTRTECLWAWGRAGYLMALNY